ncbi:MAG: IS701 family transposase [Phormidium tanganyikae FI6-MK23]|jgi:SRSO17 transposase|nr:IS701 family transposase [Phormidium tanganyikae FI6-MK23]
MDRLSIDPSQVFLTGQALEAVCEWSNALKSFQQRLSPYFTRTEARQAAFNYIQALLSPVERKNGWQIAEQVGNANPYRVQHLLGRAQWDAEKVCQEVRQYGVEGLSESDDIFAVDETGFLKQGHQSVGVQVQYYGTTGHLENCQVGVFLAYITGKGHTLIDRRLYWPKSWADDADKRSKAGVPKTVEFATKAQLAQQMLQSAWDAGLRSAWVVADEVYGNDAGFWWWLEKTGQQPYVLTVNKKQPVVIGWQPERAEAVCQSLSPEQWQRLSCGQGSKGEREYEWARVAINCGDSGEFQRWLVFRRSLEQIDPPHHISYYQVFAPKDTSLATIAQVAGKRWGIEECFKLAKSQLGLADYEVRSWVGWHRHMTLVIAAQVFLSGLRAQVEPRIKDAESASPPLALVGSLAVFKALRGLSSN